MSAVIVRHPRLSAMNRKKEGVLSDLGGPSPALIRAHVLRALVEAHGNGNRPDYRTLAVELGVRAADTRQALSRLHRDGFFDVMRAQLTLNGLAAGAAVRALDLPSLRALPSADESAA